MESIGTKILPKLIIDEEMDSITDHQLRAKSQIQKRNEHRFEDEEVPSDRDFEMIPAIPNSAKYNAPSHGPRSSKTEFKTEYENRLANDNRI